MGASHFCRFSTITTTALGFLFAPTAYAADPAVKCESGKLKESGKYASCRLQADNKAVKKATLADYSKCEAKFTAKFNKAEAKAGLGICPSEGDESAINARITTNAAAVATLLAGGDVSVCGNGVLEVAEDCDFGQLNGETCATQGLFGDGLACTPGSCVLDTSGCAVARYEDTGLGTVIDHQTGLEWQKTDTAGGLTDVSAEYTWGDDGWADSSYYPDYPYYKGSAFATFLSGLNNCTSGDGAGVTGGFGGYCDWRIPQLNELLTLVDDCPLAGACLDPIFGPIRVGYVWTSTTNAAGALDAWAPYLVYDEVELRDKNSLSYARAVRGGL